MIFNIYLISNFDNRIKKTGKNKIVGNDIFNITMSRNVIKRNIRTERTILLKYLKI